jgi:site-specific DNA-adenine methylase
VPDPILDMPLTDEERVADSGNVFGPLTPEEEARIPARHRVQWETPENYGDIPAGAYLGARIREGAGTGLRLLNAPLVAGELLGRQALGLPLPSPGDQTPAGAYLGTQANEAADREALQSYTVPKRLEVAGDIVQSLSDPTVMIAPAAAGERAVSLAAQRLAAAAAAERAGVKAAALAGGAINYGQGTQQLAQQVADEGRGPTLGELLNVPVQAAYETAGEMVGPTGELLSLGKKRLAPLSHALSDLPKAAGTEALTGLGQDLSQQVLAERQNIDWRRAAEQGLRSGIAGLGQAAVINVPGALAESIAHPAADGISTTAPAAPIAVDPEVIARDAMAAQEAPAPEASALTPDEKAAGDLARLAQERIAADQRARAAEADLAAAQAQMAQEGASRIDQTAQAEQSAADDAAATEAAQAGQVVQAGGEQARANAQSQLDALKQQVAALEAQISADPRVRNPQDTESASRRMADDLARGRPVDPAMQRAISEDLTRQRQAQQEYEAQRSDLESRIRALRQVLPQERPHATEATPAPAAPGPVPASPPIGAASATPAPAPKNAARFSPGQAVEIRPSNGPVIAATVQSADDMGIVVTMPNGKSRNISGKALRRVRPAPAPKGQVDERISPPPMATPASPAVAAEPQPNPQETSRGQEDQGRQGQAQADAPSLLNEGDPGGNKAQRAAFAAPGFANFSSGVSAQPRPLSAYLGNKRTMLESGAYDGLIREGARFNRVVEPFGGSGLAGTAVNPGNAPRVLNDLDPDTINFHRQVKANAPAVIGAVRAIADRFRAFISRAVGMSAEAASVEANSLWNQVKTSHQDGGALQAAWTSIEHGPWSVHGSSQGLVRKIRGQKTLMNVDAKLAFTEHNIQAWSDALRNVELRSEDARAVLDGAGQGDLAIVDPPYAEAGRKVADYDVGKDLASVPGAVAFIDQHVAPAAQRGAHILYTNYPDPAIMAALHRAGLATRIAYRRSTNGRRAEVIAWTPGGPLQDAGRGGDTQGRAPGVRAEPVRDQGTAVRARPAEVPAGGEAPGRLAGAERAEAAGPVGERGDGRGGRGDVAPEETQAATAAPSEPASAPSAPQAPAGPTPAQEASLARAERALRVQPGVAKVERTGPATLTMTMAGGLALDVHVDGRGIAAPAEIAGNEAAARAWLASQINDGDFRRFARLFSQAMEKPPARLKEAFQWWAKAQGPEQKAKAAGKIADAFAGMDRRVRAAVIAEAAPWAQVRRIGDRFEVSLKTDAIPADATLADVAGEEVLQVAWRLLPEGVRKAGVKAMERPDLEGLDTSDLRVEEAAAQAIAEWIRGDMSSLKPVQRTVVQRVLDAVRDFLNRLRVGARAAAGRKIAEATKADIVRRIRSGEVFQQAPATGEDANATPRLVAPRDERLDREAVAKQWGKATGERPPKPRKTWGELESESRARDQQRGVAYSVPRDGDYPRAGAVVDGLKVRDAVPNRGSIGSTLDNYEVLPGIREVPIAHFHASPTDLFYAKDDVERARALAGRIAESGEINPLIVVVDKDGPYVLEGAHRLGALSTMGKATFPALVVRDMENAKDAERGVAYSGPRLPSSIDVDGAQRPTLNSDGKPIAKDEESVRNFWRWFGDSKVVDEQGRPRVMYHGTTYRSGFSVFKGGYFTSERDRANAYTEDFNPSEFGTFDNVQSGVVYPVYIRIEKPFMRDEGWAGNLKDVPIGNDGVIGTGRGGNGIVAVVTAPSQVKSATGNRGAFDGASPDIGFATERPTNPVQGLQDAAPKAEPETFAQWQADADEILGDEKRRARLVAKAESYARLGNIRAKLSDERLTPGEQIALRRMVADAMDEAQKSPSKPAWEQVARLAVARKAAGTSVARELASRRLDLSTPEGRRELILSFATEMGPRWRSQLKRARNAAERNAVYDRWATHVQQVQKRVKGKYGIDLSDPRLGTIFKDAYSTGRLLDAIADESGDRNTIGKLFSYYLIGNILGAGSVAVNITGYPILGAMGAAHALTEATYKALRGRYDNRQLASFGGVAAGGKAFVSALGRGLVNGALAVATGRQMAQKAARPISDLQEEYHGRAPGRGLGRLLTIAAAPALEASRFVDEVAWTMAYEASLAQRALDAKAAGDPRTVEQIRSNPDDNLIEEAAAAADWFTLKNKPEGETSRKVFGAIQALRNPDLLRGIGIPLNPGFILLPFFHAIANLTVEGLRTSAYGVIGNAAAAAYRARRAANADSREESDRQGVKVVQNVARTLLGAALFAFVYAHGDDDDKYKVTGSPTNSKTPGEGEIRDRVEKPRTIGGWDYSRYDPLALPASLDADLRDAIKAFRVGKPVGKTLSDLGEKAWSATIDRPFLQGISRLFKKEYDSEGQEKGMVRKFAENAASMADPGRQYLTSYNRLTEDKAMRGGGGIVGNTIDPRRPSIDLFGQQEDVQGGIIAGQRKIPSPETQRWYEAIYAANEAVAAKGGETWWPSIPKRSLDLGPKTVRLTDDQLEQLQRDTGRLFLARLEQRVGIINAPPERMLKAMKEIREGAAEAARTMMKRKMALDRAKAGNTASQPGAGG